MADKMFSGYSACCSSMRVWRWISRTHVKARSTSVGKRKERQHRRETGLLASQASPKRRLQVQCQDLPQKERWKVMEGDIQCWLQAHTGECICTGVHMLHLHVPQSSTTRDFLSLFISKRNVKAEVSLSVSVRQNY